MPGMGCGVSCTGFPQPATVEVGPDGRTRAVCLCRRRLVLIADVPNRRDTWRHQQKRKVLR